MRAAADKERRVTGLTAQMGEAGEQSSSEHTSLSAGHIHLIINAFQLVANEREARGHLKREQT